MRSGLSASVPSNQVANLIEQISNGSLKFYVVNSSGPTNYLIKEEGSETKFKVLIGTTKSCTCKKAYGSSNKAVCSHILFVMLKVFRLPKDLPMVWQTSLWDNEIEDILHGRITKDKATVSQKHRFLKRSTKAGLELKFNSRRPVVAGEVCPICQEEFDAGTSPKNLTHCKVGCGNCVHTTCMKIWAEHKISVKEKVTCPLCRVDWGPYALLELRSQQRPRNGRRLKRNDHPRNFRCQQCQACPIVGKLYLCLECPLPFVALCGKCFDRGCHKRSGHNFAMKTNGLDVWNPVLRSPERVVVEAAPLSLINELQGRDITADDYQLLLSLDERNKSPDISFPKYLCRLLRRTRPMNAAHERCQCGSCTLVVSSGENSRMTPCCGRTYHRDCLEEVLSGLRQYLCPHEDCQKPLLPGFGYYLEMKQSKKKILQEPPDKSSMSSLAIEVIGTGHARGGGQVRLPNVDLKTRRRSGASSKNSKMKCSDNRHPPRTSQNPRPLHRVSSTVQSLDAAVMNPSGEVLQLDLGICIRPQSLSTRYFG